MSTYLHLSLSDSLSPSNRHPNKSDATAPVSTWGTLPEKPGGPHGHCLLSREGRSEGGGEVRRP